MDDGTAIKLSLTLDKNKKRATFDNIHTMKQSVEGAAQAKGSQCHTTNTRITDAKHL